MTEAFFYNVARRPGKIHSALTIQKLFYPTLKEQRALKNESAIKHLSAAGLPIKTIAEIAKVDKKTVIKWKGRETTNDLGHSGRPSALTPQEKDTVAVLCRDRWNVSVRKLAKELDIPQKPQSTKPTSPYTVGRFIRSTDWGKVFYKVQVHPTMTDKNLADRRAFFSLLTQLGYCEDSPQGRELVEACPIH